jgi:hypothetical protein
VGDKFATAVLTRRNSCHLAESPLPPESIIKEREVLGLNSLDGEPGMPPLYSMPIIIECAILGSPHQKLTLAELRLTLKKRFGYYEKEEEKGVKSWEVSGIQFPAAYRFSISWCSSFLFSLGVRLVTTIVPSRHATFLVYV